ncbi:dienelactone hydrolase family protein [Geothrix sp. PMB-07]|uniref:dienelactone hydrolase family protein n=1 Tax=Geothrix sp. PMB-07 TaxID=3068640 RepID=UPI0027407458|nr:dienelactone hydrolase family protein [Geothrix sp. PMB-07]WLT31045.1 dienelactone hydrolase family protein [Geothrix sp. PMB-07]
MRVLALALSLGVMPAFAGQPLAYSEGATKLTGYVARPAAVKGKVPGVVVVHQWMGVTAHERKVSDDLAKLGYMALAADIYGDGVHPANAAEAGKLAGAFKGDRALYRRRIAAAIDTLKAQKGVDASRIAVIGFCFGGTGALEAARGGLPVKGVVSFHGGLDVPEGYAPAAVAAKVLVCHGADDPFVPAKDVAAFQEEMRQSKADYVFVAYAGAVHSFTQKEAGNDNNKGGAYNEAAHRRSWQHMKDFFKEIF